MDNIFQENVHGSRHDTTFALFTAPDYSHLFDPNRGSGGSGVDLNSIRYRIAGQVEAMESDDYGYNRTGIQIKTTLHCIFGHDTEFQA